MNILARRAIKQGISYAIIIAVSYFFYRAFQKNWSIVQSYRLTIEMFHVSVSFFCIVIAFLLHTYGWFITLNSLSRDKKISLWESIATVNISNLTKYIPGKIWSYALQMYWLVNAGFSKSLVLYVNFINLFITLIASSLLGVCYLVLSSSNIFPFTLVLTFLASLMVFDILFIKYNSTIFNRLIFLFNKIYKKDIRYFDISKRLLVQLHLVYFISAFCFGLAAYSMCFGIGLGVADEGMFSVMSAMIISDVVGFLAVIVPGGLGVREGVMYFLLKGETSGALFLILPIATRIIGMSVDVLLGITGLFLLKRMTSKFSAEKNSSSSTLQPGGKKPIR
jgi:uncharacterized membrane protein YbhN (UPF0104 family)